MNRREVLKTSAAALVTLLGTEAIESYPMGVNTNSKPSKLKIIDLRVVTTVGNVTERTAEIRTLLEQCYHLLKSKGNYFNAARRGGYLRSGATQALFNYPEQIAHAAHDCRLPAL